MGHRGRGAGRGDPLRPCMSLLGQQLDCHPYCGEVTASPTGSAGLSEPQRRGGLGWGSECQLSALGPGLWAERSRLLAGTHRLLTAAGGLRSPWICRCFYEEQSSVQPRPSPPSWPGSAPLPHTAQEPRAGPSRWRPGVRSLLLLPDGSVTEGTGAFVL